MQQRVGHILGSIPLATPQVINAPIATSIPSSGSVTCDLVEAREQEMQFVSPPNTPQHDLTTDNDTDLLTVESARDGDNESAGSDEPSSLQITPHDGAIHEEAGRVSPLDLESGFNSSGPLQELALSLHTDH